MGQTRIQWTDATWNPVTGCTKVSQGCKHCYAERVFPRAYGKERKFTDVRTHPDRLDQPLRWKKPRRVFVNSMSDLFHEDVPASFIGGVFDVMWRAPQHTFQVLTKRPQRMLHWLQAYLDRVPAANIWLGVSVEDQATADERIPLLLRTPAAVRFVSYEPALGPVDITRISLGKAPVRTAWSGDADQQFKAIGFTINALKGARTLHWPGLDWVIVGGESGPKARPFDVQWARDTIRQCRAAGVPCFVKQLGANIRDRNDAGFDAYSETWAEGPDIGKPTNPSAWPDPRDIEDLEATIYQGAPVRVRLKDHSAGDPSEWPEDLRVREWPRQPEC